MGISQQNMKESLDILAVSNEHLFTVILLVEYVQTVARERERESARMIDFVSIKSVPF